MIKLYDDTPIILREDIYPRGYIPISDYYQTTLDWNEYQSILDEFRNEVNIGVEKCNISNF